MQVNLICGVDEAGRGPLAGPVYAAAVILGPDFDTKGLRDSKKLSESKRYSLAVHIKKNALTCQKKHRLKKNCLQKVILLRKRED